jgi:hypothetical protein
VQGQLCYWQTPRCHRTLLARSTGNATKGWATINALQFLGADPCIKLLTVRMPIKYPAGSDKARAEIEFATMLKQPFPSPEKPFMIALVVLLQDIVIKRCARV